MCLQTVQVKQENLSDELSRFTTLDVGVRRQDPVLAVNARVAEIALSSPAAFPRHIHSDLVEQVFCLPGKVALHCLELDAAA